MEPTPVPPIHAVTSLTAFLAVSTCLLVAASPQVSAPEPRPLDLLIESLDANGDGLIDPYEAADVVTRMVQESAESGPVTTDSLHRAIASLADEQRREAREMILELDEDGDGELQLAEIPPSFRPLAAPADRDADGRLSVEECMNVKFSAADMARAEAAMLIEEYDEDGDGRIRLDGLAWLLRSELADLDLDGDGAVTLDEAARAIAEENPPASFAIEGDTAIMTGVIDAATPGRVLELIVEHPSVRTISMPDLPGSMDDESNLRAAQLLRAHGFATHVPDGGMIASGGVDLFLAGRTRTLGKGARVGVHSWDSPSGEGAELPRDHEEHDMFLDYYREMGIAADFYWYTLTAAPADDIHWMTAEEIERFAVERDEDD